MPPDTTLAMFAREEGRTRAPAAVHEAVKRAGGQVVAQATVKPWELPKWVRAQAAGMGVELDMAGAAALVGQVGERQQRLLRELEKLALELDSDSPGRVSVEDGREPAPARDPAAVPRVHRSPTRSLGGGPGARPRARDMRLHEQGERLAGLTNWMASRLREALAVALRLQAGESAAEVRRGLRMPPRAAERFIKDVAASRA